MQGTDGGIGHGRCGGTTLQTSGVFSRRECEELAECLLTTLRQRGNTSGRRGWTDKNFALLRRFATMQKAQSYPSSSGARARRRGKQFLWDFVAYIQGKGLLLAAESEHNNSKHEIERDFEKLLYVRSPLKLMLCRVASEAQANRIKGWLERFMRKTCAWYSPGEVMILYCVWWAERGGANRDFAYMLQLNGNLNYVPLTTEQFRQV
jgi:hypothetical protein